MAVTIKHIAEKSGLSWPTVSRILNNKGGPFRPETRRRVLQVANDLGYRPNSAARAMRDRKSRQIGVLLRNAPDRPFHYLTAFEIILGINARLEPAGYVLSLVRFETVSGEDAQQSRVFREHLLDGMIVVGWYPDEVYRRVDELVDRCVWLETNVWRKQQCIRRDETHTGTLVAQKLASLGYREAIWLGPAPRAMPTHFSVNQRYDGLEATCRRLGVSLRQVLVQRRADLKLIVPDLPNLLRPEVAVVAYDTQMAIALTQHAGALGRCAGRDYGLVCCDETEEVVEAWPGLSRVSNDRFNLGYQAAQMMLHTLEHRRERCASRLVKGHWVAGHTAWGPAAANQGQPPLLGSGTW